MSTKVLRPPDQAGPAATARWVLLASVLASSMAFIDGTALPLVFPALQADLGASGADLLWVLNAYALFVTSFLLLGGALGDLHGRKRILTLGILVFTGASVLCGLAPNPAVLIAARAVQGVGAALLIPGSLALLTAFAEVGVRGKAIGTWSALSMVATALGPVAGGLLAGNGLWRGIFFLNLPLAIIALVVLRRHIPESRHDDNPPRLDYRGAALGTLGLFGINYGLIESVRSGWSDPLILLALTGGLAALLLFVLVERRAAYPLFPLALFRARTFVAVVLLTLCLYGGFNALVLFLPLNLIQVQGYGAALAGLAQLPVMVLLVALSRWAGGVADGRGPRLPLTVGPAVAGGGFLLCAVPGLTHGAVDYWTQYLPALCVLGLGMALTCAPMSATLIGSVRADYSGLASGINSTTARLAGLLAVSVLGSAGLLVFQGTLARRAGSAELPAGVQQALQSEAANLGNVRIPAGLDATQREAARDAIRLAFVDTFRLVCIIAAGLAWLGALAAYLLIPRRPPGPGP